MRWNKAYVFFWAFLSHIIPIKYRPVFCLGDSHGAVWNFVDLYQQKFLPRFVPFIVSGATALGLSNPNSKTNAFNEFHALLKRLPYGTHIIFNLGEVDCGFLIWLLEKRENETIDTVFHRAIDSYLSFINECRTLNFEIYICAAPLPTIEDGPAIGEIAKARKDISVPQRERTKLTLAWNLQLRKYCTATDITFVDTDDILLDKTTELIRPIFRNSIIGDHHLDPHAYAIALLLALRNIKKTQ